MMNLKVSVSAVLVSVIALSSCQKPTESAEYKALQQKSDSLQTQVAVKEQEVEEVTAMVNEIQNNLAAIEKDELSIGEIKKEGESQTQKDKINTMIAGIDGYIEQNRQKLEVLEQKVRANAGKNKSLQNMVAKLKETIVAKEAQITELRNTVSGLETEVTGLKETVVQKDNMISDKERNLSRKDSMLNARQQVIEEKDNEIYTAYFIFGTKKDLANSGIIDKTGGFLGLGKTAKISSKVDKNKFTSINIKSVDDINLGVTKKKNVISSHPADSYAILKSGEESHLKITDYKRFWSLTKYLVVETK